MNHIPVESNLLASVAYDGTNLQVLYRRGGLYNHENVTVDEFEQLLNPGPEFEHSIGKAFNAIIKGKKPAFKVEAGGHSTKPTPPLDEQVHAVLTARVEDIGVDAFYGKKPEPAPPAEPPAEVQAVSRKSNELAIQAQSIEVTNPISQREASEVLLVIASMQTEIQDVFKPMKDAAYKAHRIICEQEKTLTAPLVEAERILKGRIGGYEQEQRRLAREVEEANRQAELSRAAEEARQRAADQAIEQAVELEARGDTAAAEAVLANPAPVAMRYIAPAPVAPAVSQTKGVATRFEWAGRILDPSKVPDEYKTINESLINAVIKRTNGKIRITGVENYEKPVVATSRRG